MKIVVGIDPSEAAKDALRWAVEEARLRGAEVIALHAWEPDIPPPDLAPASGADLVEIVSEAYERALLLVTAIVEDVVGDDSSVSVSAVAVEGAAAPALVDTAQDAQLLVVGSKGETGLADVLLGSVTEECANRAPCPVLIHRRLPAA